MEVSIEEIHEAQQALEKTFGLCLKVWVRGPNTISEDDLAYFEHLFQEIYDLAGLNVDESKLEQ